MTHRRDTVEIKKSALSYNNGDPVVEDHVVLITDKCFIERYEGQNERKSVDGSTVFFSIVVHLDSVKDLPKKGDKIIATKADGTMNKLELEVKDSWNYPNIGKAKIWA